MKTATFEGFVASLKNCNITFRKWGGGGSKAVWNFSENSSVLEKVGIPYSLMHQFQLLYSFHFHFHICYHKLYFHFLLSSLFTIQCLHLLSWKVCWLDVTAHILPTTIICLRQWPWQECGQTFFLFRESPTYLQCVTFYHRRWPPPSLLNIFQELSNVNTPSQYSGTFRNITDMFVLLVFNTNP